MSGLEPPRGGQLAANAPAIWQNHDGALTDGREQKEKVTC